VSVYHHPYFEADDLIAAFTRNRPGPHIILSSDQDFFQLVRDDVIVHRPEGKSGYKFYDPDSVLDKLGVFPDEVRLFKALTGDTSDSIPGVPRLRKKIAAQLCKHKELDSLYASDLDGCSKREESLIREMEDRVRLNYDLVGFYDIESLDDYLISPDTDIDVAESILEGDLNIYRLDTDAFQNTPKKAVITSSPVFTIDASDLLD
jgi:5'-3' exonuclease